MAAALERAGVLVMGVGGDWALERQGVGARRGRLLSGLVTPALVVRRGAAAGEEEVGGWLHRARQTQLSDWLGQIAGR